MNTSALRALETVCDLANSVWHSLSNKWMPSDGITFSVDYSKERGYFISTIHRRLYANTPELVEFLSEIQVAQARTMRRIMNGIKRR